ncbi:MAG: hypothetical protein CMI12_11655 [Oceanospirillum sp.]|nr:hypothetical protein [Oceanospirillum sp.]
MLRYLDPAEHYFWLLDQVSSMNFAVMAELDQPQDINNLHNALNYLQKEQNIFQLAINRDNQGQLFLQAHPHSIQVEQFTTRDNWQQVIGKALAQRFNFEQPLIRALYIQHLDSTQAKQRSCVALVFNHAIADGRTGAELLKQWLDISADHLPTHFDTGSSDQAPIAALHKKLPAKLNIIGQDEEITRRLEQKKTEIRRYGRPQQLPTLNPVLSTKSESSSPQILSFELTPDQSSRIKQACKQHQVRIHSALTAVQLMAIYQHELNQNNKQNTGNDNSKDVTLCLTSPVDMRRYFDDEQPALGMHTTLLSSVYRLTPESDFWSLVQQADKELHQQLQRDDAAFFYQFIRPELIPCTDEVMAEFSTATLRSAPQTLISNLGIVTPSANSDVQRISFALCPMPFQPLFTAVTHYKGKLHLNITYDRSRLDDQSAQQVAEGILQQLIQL